MMPLPDPTAALIPLSLSAPWRHGFALLWLGAIALVVSLSLAPNAGPTAAFNIDKLCHLLGYATLAGLPFVTFRAGRPVYLAAAAMAPLGIVLEVLQHWVPGRTAEAGDALANLAGVVIGIALGPPGRRLANRLLATRSDT
jgi:VanZ family protein